MTSQLKTRSLLITGLSAQFPNYNSYVNSNNEQNQSFHHSTGCIFDPHCPECVRELWGPLLSPFAYLIKQNADYFDKIISRLGKYKSNRSSNKPSNFFSPTSLKPLRLPKFNHDDHKFLTTFGLCAFRTSKVGWFISWTLVFVSVIILFEISAIIYCAVALPELMSDIRIALTMSFQDHYAVPGEDRITNAWDRIFQSYQCCGWLINDFSNSHWVPPGPNAIPHSCCRPGATHPGCESILAPSNENYADQECSDSIRVSINSNGYVPILFSTVGFIIIVEIVSTILTFIYITKLKLAHRRRRKYNETLMKKFRRKMTSYSNQDTTTERSNSDRLPSRSEEVKLDNIDELHKQYTAFNKTPSNLDPSLMSITPTVVQVKRPNIYSYFSYE